MNVSKLSFLLVLLLSSFCWAEEQPTRLVNPVTSTVTTPAKPETAAQTHNQAQVDDAVAPLGEEVAKVVWVKGQLSASAPEKPQRILKKLDTIYLHDTLVTDKQTQAQIVFTDNTLMIFKPDTKFYVRDYMLADKSNPAEKGSYVMDLLKGGFRTITGLIAKNNPKGYKVNTPVATIGVRGTEYSIYLTKNGPLYLAKYSGSPCVTSQATLCLGQALRYATVKTAQSKPLALETKPAVFNQDLSTIKTTFNQLPVSHIEAPVAPINKPEKTSSICIIK